jgi:phosphatidylinositol-3-phosphatase
LKRICLLIGLLLIVAAASVAQVPASNHVVLLVEENQSYSGMISNNGMPYLNSLATKYGLATQYYANTHPSIGNYFEMTTGQIFTNDDNQTPASFPISSDNIVRELMIAGKTWKSYAEGLPSVGYTGGNSGSYAVRHNPFPYFTDVQNSSTQKLNLVPFSEFATDLANNQLPNFSFIVPNLNDDAHDGTPQQADAWLQKNIAPLLASPAFQQDGLLIITFDEALPTDSTHGGGRVATVVIGPTVKSGFKSATLYQHQNLLRTLLTALGAKSFPGAAASAPAMTDFFTSSAPIPTPVPPSPLPPTPAPDVTIISPASGAIVSSPVKFVATASGSSAAPISAMRIYVDNASMFTVSSASLNTSLALPSGTHNVTIVAWDSTGKAYTKAESVTVSGATAAAGVTIISPANGTTVSSPVQFVASARANSGHTITAVRIYVDNVSAYTVGASTLNTSLSLASGTHYVVIQAWDNIGTVYKAAETITTR